MTPFGIVMPNRNKEKYISAAIESVLAQTDPVWKLIVVDDESTDASMNILLEYKDPRILVERVSRGGPGAASRRAMEIAVEEGLEFVGVLDSDDALLPEAVRKVRREYERNPEAGLVYTQNWRCDAQMRRVELGRAIRIPEGETVLSLHEKGDFLRVNHWLTFRVSAYQATEGFAVMPRHQDMDLIFKLEEVAKLYFLNQPLYDYRITPEGLHTGSVVKDFAPEVRKKAWARRTSTS